MKTDKLSNLKSVSYHEIPPIRIVDGVLNIAYGLHVILYYKCGKELRFHKVFISASYETDLTKYSIDPQMNKYDLLAFHIFRYIKERCSFSSKEWKVLWKVLRRSNSLVQSIKLFCYFLKKYSDKSE